MSPRRALLTSALMSIVPILFFLLALERLQSYHQQHADDAAKMSGKAPKTVLLNEEDWNEWNKDPDWTPSPDEGYEYTPTTIPGKAEQKQYKFVIIKLFIIAT